jgi:Family of unknown function (DUF6498)
MFKHHLTVSDYFIIAANLIPLYGVLFMNWEASIMFLVYCMETIIIGIFNVLKMSIVNLFEQKGDENIYFGKKRPAGGWLLILFFIIHYGFFVFIQTQIFFQTSGFLNEGNFITGYSKVIGKLGHEGRLVLWIFVFSYTLQTIYSFVFSGEYKTINMGRLMFQPYGRILIQQFVVIVGSMFLTLGGGKIFMIVFVVIKIIFEVYINFDKYIKIETEKEIKNKG